VFEALGIDAAGGETRTIGAGGVIAPELADERRAEAESGGVKGSIGAEPPGVGAGGEGSKAIRRAISSGATLTEPPFSPAVWARKDSGTVATRSMMGAPTPIRSKADGVVAEAEEDMGGADK